MRICCQIHRTITCLSWIGVCAGCAGESCPQQGPQLPLLLPPVLPLLLPPLVLDTKQADNKHRACIAAAATAIKTMQPCCFLVMLPLLAQLPPSCCQCQAGQQKTLLPLQQLQCDLLSLLDAKQVHSKCRACTAAAQQCRCHFQMRDHTSIPTTGRQIRSPFPPSPPPHRSPIPFAAVRAPLMPASKPPVVNWVNMRPLDWRLALRDSGLMPIRRLLACSSPPPKSACYPSHSVAACLHAPSCRIFVLLTCNGASRRLNPIKMWPPGRPLTLHARAGVLIGLCVCLQNTFCV